MIEQQQKDRTRNEFAALTCIKADSPIIAAIPHTAMVKAIVFSSDKKPSCRQVANKYGVSIKTASTIIKEKTSMES